MAKGHISENAMAAIGFGYIRSKQQKCPQSVYTSASRACHSRIWLQQKETKNIVLLSIILGELS